MSRLTGSLLTVIASSSLLVGWLAVDELLARRRTREGVARFVADAEAAMQSGALLNASVALDSAMRLSPADPSLLDLGFRLRVESAARSPATLTDLDVAAVDYALASQASSPTVLTARANLAIRRGDVDDGRALLKEALSATPYGPAARALGNLEQSVGRRGEAVAAYELARQHDPSDHESLNNLGAIYVESGRYDEARSLLEQALTANDTVATRLNLANALIGSKRLPDAVPHLRDALRRDPSSRDVAVRLGGALRAAGELGAAEAVLVPATDAPAALYELALVHQAQQRYALAAEELSRLTAVDPRHFDGAYQLAATLQALGEAEAARVAMRRYVALATGTASEDARRTDVERVLASLEGKGGASSNAAAGVPGD